MVDMYSDAWPGRWGKRGLTLPVGSQVGDQDTFVSLHDSFRLFGSVFLMGICAASCFV